MIVFRKRFLVLSIVLFIIETIIALYILQPIIRGFLGDVLVIPLLYTLLKTFFSISSKKLLIGILFLAILTELLQYINIIEYFEIQSKLIQIIIGTTFDIYDIAAYLIGCFFIVSIESIYKKRQSTPST